MTDQNRQHGHDHNHHHHHDHQCGGRPHFCETDIAHSGDANNTGLLKYAFSFAEGNSRDFLESHRKKILFGTALVTAVVESASTKNAPVFSLPLFVTAAAVSHDAGEDVLEEIGGLEKSQGLSASVVGTAVGFGHTLAEGAFSMMASVNQSTDMAVSSVMGSQPSHILLMAGGAAVIGTLGVGKLSSWKLHAGAMGVLTATFGAQVVAGEFHPAAGAAMIAGGGYYLYRRFKEGEACAVHGSDCSGHEPDDHLHDDHVHTQKNITFKQRITDPHLLGVAGSVVTLSTAAHIMAHELVELSDIWGVSKTTLGVTVAAVSLAAPEIILTWKAAYKGAQDLAWGAVVGCSTATIGIVGGGLALSGAPIPEALDPATKEGMIHMLGFGVSTAAILAVSHPSINKKGCIGKKIGAGFLAAYMTYIAATNLIADDKLINIESGHSHSHVVHLDNNRFTPSIL